MISKSSIQTQLPGACFLLLITVSVGLLLLYPATGFTADTEDSLTVSSETKNKVVHDRGIEFTSRSQRDLRKAKLTETEREWIKAHPKIRVHNEMDWPPFNFNKNGRPQGLSIDFMNLLSVFA